MKVSLRKKKLSGGKTSLYLDVYQDGERKYEFLQLYLYEGISPTIKATNKETYRKAEAIAAKRLVDLQNSAHGLPSMASNKISFLDYVLSFTDERKKTGVNYGAWRSVTKHLRAFGADKVRLDEVNDRWLESFKAFLLTKVAQNSTHTYFNKVLRALHTAQRERLIVDNPAYRVKSPRMNDTHREFLVEEELKRLVNADCRRPILKRAFLFSTFTGLRWSDIQKLTWSEIRHSEEHGHSIDFSQAKTKSFEYLPIPEHAMALLGERQEPSARVFQGLKYSAEMNIVLCQWVLKAGITKHITFHCARHTYATLLLTKGAHLYTVSKLLGHREIRTTQVYAKVVDETKRAAVDFLPKMDF